MSGKDSRGISYEDTKLLNEYLMLHYGQASLLPTSPQAVHKPFASLASRSQIGPTIRSHKSFHQVSCSSPHGPALVTVYPPSHHPPTAL